MGLIGTGMIVAVAVQPADYIKNALTTASNKNGKSIGVVERLQKGGVKELTRGFGPHMQVSALGLVCQFPVNEAFRAFFTSQNPKTPNPTKDDTITKENKHIDTKIKNEASISTAIVATAVTLKPSINKIRAQAATAPTGQINPRATAVMFTLDMIVKLVGAYSTSLLVNSMPKPEGEVSNIKSSPIKPISMEK
jgi:hypothetical protein